MQVTYTMSPEDVLALEEYQIRKTRGLSFNQMLGVLFAIVLVAPLLGYLWPGGESERRIDVANLLLSLGIPVVTVVVVVVVTRWHAARRVRNLDREIPGVYQPRSLRLEPESLVAMDATGEGATRWTAVKDVWQTPDRIFILLVGDIGYVIPKRAFASADEATQFAEAATALWRGQARSA